MKKPPEDEVMDMSKAVLDAVMAHNPSPGAVTVAMSMVHVAVSVLMAGEDIKDGTSARAAWTMLHEWGEQQIDTHSGRPKVLS